MIMPNFLVIGTGKAGTTSLYHYLKEHPEIYMSPHKEPRFFAFEGESVDFRGPGDLTKTKFVTDIEDYRALFKDVTNEKAIGESSVCYLYIPKASERIQYHLPNAKLIVMLREPVERAYSNFLHLVRSDMETLTDFTQAMSAEKERIFNHWSHRWHYRQKGFYYIQLKRYFERFDASQIKIYLYEDFKDNPLRVIQDIFRFLDVDDTFVPNMSQKYNVSGIPRNKAIHKLLKSSHVIREILRPIVPSNLRLGLRSSLIDLNLRKKPQLLPEVRKQFIVEYREDILKLQDLIQKDLSQWLET